MLILLGDEPLRWFLGYFTSLPKRLADFKEYGHPHSTEIHGLKLGALPLAHPFGVDPHPSGTVKYSARLQLRITVNTQNSVRTPHPSPVGPSLDFVADDAPQFSFWVCVSARFVWEYFAELQFTQSDC